VQQKETMHNAGQLS